MDRIIDPGDATPLTFRQKLAVKLILFAVAIIRPWEYDHQADAYLKDIKPYLD